jgi:hypothetical protein
MWDFGTAVQMACNILHCTFHVSCLRLRAPSCRSSLVAGPGRIAHVPCPLSPKTKKDVCPSRKTVAMRLPLVLSKRTRTQHPHKGLDKPRASSSLVLGTTGAKR